MLAHTVSMDEFPDISFHTLDKWYSMEVSSHTLYSDSKKEKYTLNKLGREQLPQDLHLPSPSQIFFEDLRLLELFISLPFQLLATFG